MKVTRAWRLAAAVVLLIPGLARPAGAQDAVPARVSAETSVSLTMFSPYKHLSGMLDTTVSVDASHGLTFIARPWVWRRPDGTSTYQWYQLQVRYRSHTRIPFRVDAGVITSPFGLATLQQRADLNPTIAPVFYYVIPLPRFDATFDGLHMLAAGYPLGAIVTASGARWDLRGGVTDSTPARPQVELKRNQRPKLPQVVVAGGFTPRAGLRVGAGLARGRYRNAVDPFPAADATVFTLEGEYTVNHTRLSGEWVNNHFDTRSGTASGRAFYGQGVQTITARLFGAGRIARTDTPPIIFGTLRPKTSYTTAELTAGYRVSRDLTVRGGYYAVRSYLATDWDSQAAVSVVWARRWY